MDKCYLLVDMGNSLCKLRLYTQNDQNKFLSFTSSYSNLDSFILTNLASYKIEYCIVCSVTDDITTSNFINQLQKFIVTKIKLFDTINFKLLPSKYSKFSSLGNDRWCSILAIFLQGFKNYCIIDCGTAITVDYVINGVHEGGLISPGINTFVSSLTKSTKNIGDPKSKLRNDNINFMATTTSSCISYASTLYFNSYIDTILSKNALDYGDCFISYITGGDFSLYQNINNYHLKIKNNLVLDGLNLINKTEYEF